MISAPLAVAVLFLAAFGGLLRGDKSIATFVDNTYLYLPLFHHISASFGRGEYPYWINTLMGGIPLYDNPNFSLLYPLYFFQTGIYADAGGAILRLHYVTFLHIFIAYLNCYVLLRVLRLAPLPALLGASVFALSQNTMAYAVWIAIIAPYSWLPLALAGAFLILENRHGRAGVLLLTGSLTLTILASAAHALIHATILIAVLWVFNAARRWKNGELGALVCATKNLFKVGALTLLLGSPVLLPFLLHLKGMIRFASNDPPVIGFGRLTYQATLYGQLEVAQLAGALLPYFVPSTIGHPFVGLCAALLALLAVFKARSNWIVLPLLFVTAYALLSATGSHLGLARINYLLPLLNKFREPDRHLFVFVLGVSILSAFGFAYLTEALAGRKRELLDLKHLAVGVLSLVLLWLALGANLPYIGVIPKWQFLCLSGSALLLPLTLPFFKGRARHVPPALAALLVICSSLAFPKRVPDLQAGDFFTTANLASRQTLDELARIEGVRNYRFLFADAALGEPMWAMNASYYGLRSFYIYHNMLPYRQFTEVYLPQFKPGRYSLLLGARYYLCSRCESVPPDDYSYQREINGYRLYVAERALPRYALFTRVAGAYESWEDFYSQVNQGADFRAGLYVGRAEAARVADWVGGQTPPSDIKEEHSSLNRLRLRAGAGGRSVLLLNEYYNADWEARVNGARAETLKVNGNQIGVLLGSGPNVVEFEYRPTLYLRLLWVQRATLFALGLYALFRAYRYASGRRARSVE